MWFLSQCINSLLKDNDIGFVILFDLDYSWYQQSRWFKQLDESQLDRLIVIGGIGTITELLRSIRSIADYSFFDSRRKDQPLISVIIDNLSVFHWELSYQGTLNEEYSSLTSLLYKVRVEFGASIITTSFDSGFESGMVKTKVQPSMSKDPVSEWSCIPSVFYTKVDRVLFLHLMRDGVVHGEYWKQGEMRAHTIPS
jgi:hypothetical protein